MNSENRATRVLLSEPVPDSTWLEAALFFFFFKEWVLDT